MPAFKLPSDKVNCVSRVASTIMNLLSLAADRLVPAADDFLPVLVYVIIQANPPGLLSTGNRLQAFNKQKIRIKNCDEFFQFRLNLPKKISYILDFENV